jgi:UDP-sulfoquinovose synthase
MMTTTGADFEALIERSSLGTAGAGMLRGRATQSRAGSIGRGAGVLRVLVTGGDGYCGWPTSLYLSDRGHDVTILDNLSRRRTDVELGTVSLTPIRPIGERLRAWHEVSGRAIGFHNLDLATEYERLASLLRDIRPDVIVHFAAQRAAPYSMKSAAAKR